ncbi:DNA ligase 1-like [Gouania willdenowi]|uniref:DNA ligase 1-like n=1 Tax=Gouania willdenowi TaxID=441366 RepID=UPI00105559AC|nr:DNA ligase 1-like [Gouania willdenowi]
MQRSIASFFQPKTKDVKKKTSDEATKKPVKSPLKVQNGVQEVESPVKKVTKRSRQILDSDEDDVPVVKEQATPKRKEAIETLDKTEKKEEDSKAAPTPLSPPPAPAAPVVPATPATTATPATPATPASSASPESPSSISPSGIVKRKTARKMFPKRKLDESRSDGESQGEASPDIKEEEGHQNKRPRVADSISSAENTDETMEEGLKGEEVEMEVATEAKSPNQELEKKKEEEERGTEKQVIRRSLNKKEKKAKETGSKSKAKKKSEEEKTITDANTEEAEKDIQDVEGSPKSQTAKKQKEAKEQKDKESAKKTPISSFFAPRKAAVKMEETEKKEGEEKVTSTEKESKDKKR